MKIKKYSIWLCSILFIIITLLVKFDVVSKFDTFIYEIVTFISYLFLMCIYLKKR